MAPDVLQDWQKDLETSVDLTPVADAVTAIMGQSEEVKKAVVYALSREILEGEAGEFNVRVSDPNGSVLLLVKYAGPVTTELFIDHAETPEDAQN